MTALSEQEVTVTWLRDEGLVRIYTSNPVEARRLRKETRVTQVKGDETWGEFTVGITDFHPLKGFKTKRKPLTDEQKDALRERMKRLHNKTSETH